MELITSLPSCRMSMQLQLFSPMGMEIKSSCSWEPITYSESVLYASELINSSYQCPGMWCDVMWCDAMAVQTTNCLEQAHWWTVIIRKQLQCLYPLFSTQKTGQELIKNQTDNGIVLIKSYQFPSILIKHQNPISIFTIWHSLSSDKTIF